MSMVRRSIDHPVTIVMIFVLLSGVAAIFVGRIPIALNPETERPMLSVNTSYSGAGPEDVEENVTIPLENALSSLEGLKSISSRSSQGSSNINLEFGYEVDLDKAQSEIESIASGFVNRLPDDADTPRVRRFDMNAMPIMRLIISGDRSLEELQTLGEEEVQPRLERIEGCRLRQRFGGKRRNPECASVAKQAGRIRSQLQFPHLGLGFPECPCIRRLYCAGIHPISDPYR